jgi:hypothetical protein
MTWQDHALCANADPELFFPKKGGATLPAKAVCAHCGVRQECLNTALRNGEQFGVWGGFSRRQRSHLTAGGSQEEREFGPDEPRTLRQLYARGGPLAGAGLAFETVRRYASNGDFVEPCGTGSHGARI